LIENLYGNDIQAGKLAHVCAHVFGLCVCIYNLGFCIHAIFGSIEFVMQYSSTRYVSNLIKYLAIRPTDEHLREKKKKKLIVALAAKLHNCLKRTLLDDRKCIYIKLAPILL